MRNKVVLISGRQIQVKWKNKLFELFCGPILNYDRNDDKHVYKNNNHDDYDIDHYATSHDYYNNFNNDSKSSKIEKRTEEHLWSVGVLFPTLVFDYASLLNKLTVFTCEFKIISE